MKRIISTLLIASSVLSTFAQIDTTSNLTNTEKILGLSLFWKEASYNFAYFDKANINWDSAYEAFIPKVQETKNTYEYYRVLQRFCALLKDGHTNVSMPAYIQKGSINTDIGFVYLENKILLTGIARKDSSLVPLGSELIKVNDIPISDFLKNEIFPYISYSAIHQLYNTAMWRIVSPPFAYNNKSVHLTFRTPLGKIVSYDPRINTGNKEWTRLPLVATREFFKLLPNNIAYVQLWHFRDTSIVSKFKSYLPELYKASGVILDIRGNGGGSSDVGVEILKYFTDQKLIKGSAWKTPDHVAAFKAWGQLFKPEDTAGMSENDKQLMAKSFKVAKQDYWFGEDASVYENNLIAPRINTPLVVLIGNNTGSAAEDFLISLDDVKGRAITIGEPTYGSTGQPLSFNLPGGGSARVCTKKDTYPDGREFVGYGIKPNIEIKPTFADMMTGKDIVLEKAIAVVAEKIKKKN